MPNAKSSRRPIDFSGSEESEYESEGEPHHRNDDDAEQDFAEENEEREQGEEEETYAESEEEAEVKSSFCNKSSVFTSFISGFKMMLIF